MISSISDTPNAKYKNESVCLNKMKLFLHCCIPNDFVGRE